MHFAGMRCSHCNACGASNVLALNIGVSALENFTHYTVAQKKAGLWCSFSVIKRNVFIRETLGAFYTFIDVFHKFF